MIGFNPVREANFATIHSIQAQVPDHLPLSRLELPVFVGVPSPFFPGIFLSTSGNRGKRIRLLERAMVEKSGESNPRVPSPFSTRAPRLPAASERSDRPPSMVVSAVESIDRACAQIGSAPRFCCFFASTVLSVAQCGPTSSSPLGPWLKMVAKHGAACRSTPWFGDTMTTPWFGDTPPPPPIS